MYLLFLSSLRLHCEWFVRSFSRAGREHAPLRGQRILVLCLGFPAFLLIQAVHIAGFLLDDCFFRGYRRVAVRAPLFVTGVPRSGTTFVHRSLAQDKAHFTTFRTWEALLAPSVTERRCWKAAARFDRSLGGHGRRTLEKLTRRLTGDFSAVHAVGLDAPEEDYFTLLPVGGCFLLTLVFPFSPHLWQLGRFRGLPPARRESLLAFYRACLQKHLYVEGNGRHLLSKNAAFASWIPDLRRTFPDARFLICVREPLDALSSQLSSLQTGRQLCGSDPDGIFFKEQFRELFEGMYKDLRDELARDSAGLAVLEQGDLRAHAADLIPAALEQLGLTVSNRLRHSLALAASPQPCEATAHRHTPETYGLTAETIGPCLSTAFEAIIAHRVSSPRAPSKAPERQIR